MQLTLRPKSRTTFLVIVITGLMAIFVVRLFYLQIIKHDYYVAVAAKEQIKRLTIPAERGAIYALDNDTPVPLVMNQTVYTLFADPYVIKDDQKVLAAVQEVAGGNMRPNSSALLQLKQTRYQILATELTRQQAEILKDKKIKGIGFQEVSRRVYPEGGLAAQVLGFVNHDGLGQYGVEEKLNGQLKGTDGVLQSVTDVSSVPLTIGKDNINKPAQHGRNIVLTIDRNVQAVTERALAEGLTRTKAKKGSAIVMDPQTGRVLAMANLPSYNPSEFTKVTDAEAFNNTAIGVPYEAGSVIKTFTVATGLDKGVIRPDSTFNNTDKIKIGDREITNATKGQTGTTTIQKALTYSLNTGMVAVAQRLGGGTLNQQARTTMYDYFYGRFGLGEKTGIEIAGEAKGDLIPPSSPLGNAVQYATMSFGQGMNVTMIQAAAAFSSVINGGTYYQPTIIAGSIDSKKVFRKEPVKVIRSNVVSEATSQTARGMVHEARRFFYARKDKPGYEVGGKTGTSQTLRNGQYVDDQTIASYLGYGGDTAPRYVIMVQVSGKDMNLQGGDDAMPIFTDISNQMIDYLKLQPKG